MLCSLFRSAMHPLRGRVCSELLPERECLWGLIVCSLNSENTFMLTHISLNDGFACFYETVVKENLKWGTSERVCVRMCVCARASTGMCVCVCVHDCTVT